MPKTITRPITRETPDVECCFFKTLMIGIEPGSRCLKIWQKGSRRKYAIRYRDIFRAAMLASEGPRTPLRTK